MGDCFTRPGAASQPQPPVERLHEGLGGLGDLIRCAGRAQERPFGAVTPLERRDEYYALFVFVGGAVSMLFVLRVVAGACVGRWTGQPRMPPRERQHEGVGFLRRRKGAGNSGMMAV